MGKGHERRDGKRNRSAQTRGEKARLKAKKNRPAKGRLGKALRVERRIGRQGVNKLLRFLFELFKLLALNVQSADVAAAITRMIAVFTVVVVRVACNIPMAGFPRVGIARCKGTYRHDAHSFGFNTARSTWGYPTILFLYYTISEVN